MIDSVERIVNLALYLADARRPVTAEQVRSEVSGYPSEQDYAAFARMFERDKDELRRSGFNLAFDEERQVYSLDRSATFAAPVELTAEEAAAVRAAGTAVLGDPSFPFAADLRLALVKIAAELPGDPATATARLADEDPARQGTTVAALSDAGSRSKVVRFGYTNSMGASALHEVEPYGLFVHDGRWYLVARDTSLDEVRTYAVARMSDVKINTSAPKTPDFERPADFDVSRFISLPFQYGPDELEFEAVLRFDPDSAWRARALSRGQGTLETDGDSLLWRVAARSRRGLLKFAIENGPGIRIVDPPDFVAELADGLARVEALHG